jgi:hypothetical protein
MHNPFLATRRFKKVQISFLNLLFAQGELTSFHPKVTCSPSESPDPEKSSVNTVIFDGRRIIAASLASALHPLENNNAYQLIPEKTKYRIS